jgi:hypothetical protein
MECCPVPSNFNESNAGSDLRNRANVEAIVMAVTGKQAFIW